MRGIISRGLILLAVTGGWLTAGEAHPLADAVVGEWVLYDMQNNMQQRQTVTAVAENEVTVEVQTIVNGKVVATTPTTHSLQAPEGEGEAGDAPAVQTSEEALTIGGQELACMVTAVEAGGQQTRTWTCAAVPVLGLVKSMVGENVVMQLREFGVQAGEGEAAEPAEGAESEPATPTEGEGAAQPEAQGPAEAAEGEGAPQPEAQ